MPVGLPFTVKEVNIPYRFHEREASIRTGDCDGFFIRSRFAGGNIVEREDLDPRDGLAICGTLDNARNLEGIGVLAPGEHDPSNLE